MSLNQRDLPQKNLCISTFMTSIHLGLVYETKRDLWRD